MAVEAKVTFCRICEATCGLVATVEDGELARLRPDPDHPLSSGYACPKGIAMTEVQNDPDRVLRPLKRTGGPGEFEPVSWEEAMADIGGRMRGVIERSGKDSIAWYIGNPSAFSYSHALWVKGFLDGLGTPHYYGAGSQDVNNRFAASAMLYGNPVIVPIPDVERTEFLLMIGANPLVSHGSLITAPRIKDHLSAIESRGGRVLVVDPRRTETAGRFEHVPVNPDSDAWLMLSLIHTVFEEGLADRDFLLRHADGAAELEALSAGFPPEDTEGRTGIEAERVRAIARDFCAADGAAAYGRTGSCLGRFGTLVAFLIDALNAVTGNIDRPGGAVFGAPSVALDEVGEKIGLTTYGKRRSRVGDFPDVLGTMPASLLPEEIATPGEGQVRALFVSAGNPVLSVPDGDAMERSCEDLDLMVSLDFYVNETNQHADYVLPTTTFLERDDVPIALLSFHAKPFIQSTEAVVPPRGEAREEWEIVEDLAREAGIEAASAPALRLLGKVGVRLSPKRLLDVLIRTGADGDLFGLRRGGLSLAKLAKHPHGIVLKNNIPTGVLGKKVRHSGGRLALAPEEIVTEIARLGSVNGGDPRFPLRLIGLRELRSHNSWMHNAPLLMRGGREQPLRIHPDDAAELGIEDGISASVASKHGELTVPVRVTDEMTPGAVALPHGWGHRGGWKTANKAGGVNVNVLAGSAPEDLERLAGMALLNGIPVRVSPVAPAAAEAEREAASASA
ncbi:MAG: molybdopterin-dependent oxidoreductase [Thermoleophilaceae bacterium]|nr:molybdopterin-dependent oxidoreductase [Thermoleophilaceae bacterium]